jgi:hypothetical protein
MFLEGVNIRITNGHHHASNDHRTQTLATLLSERTEWDWQELPQICSYELFIIPQARGNLSRKM